MGVEEGGEALACADLKKAGVVWLRESTMIVLVFRGDQRISRETNPSASIIVKLL